MKTHLVPVVAALALAGGTMGVLHATANEAATAAGGLVERAIAFHDPDGLWGGREITIVWAGTDADGAQRLSLTTRFGTDGSDFSMSGRYRGNALEYRATADGWSATVDGETDPGPEVRERMRLDREGGFFWRSYFGFLAGLPMKLSDPGTIVGPEVAETRFQGREVRAVRVTYDPEVGGDTWYFYFDPETTRLVGCRFHHDESANDGEYIVFEGLVSDGTLRLPRHRRWYVNKDDRFLGADEIRSVEVSP